MKLEEAFRLFGTLGVGLVCSMASTARVEALVALPGSESGSNAADKLSLVYSDTKICSSHKSTFCLALDDDSDYLTLSKRPSQHLKFNVDPTSQTYLSIKNKLKTFRLYTTSGGGELCMVQTAVNDETFVYDSVTLAPCGTSDYELFLTLTTTEEGVTSPQEITGDDFQLKTHDANSAQMCFTATYKTKGSFGVPQKRVSLHTGSPIALTACDSEASGYAQSFEAIDYVARSVAVAKDPAFGFYCLSEKPDLCLGISLTNGVLLEEDKFVQVKNLTKNDAKDLVDMKLEWYKRRSEDDNKLYKLANGEELSYCLEAMYHVDVGPNRANKKVYDDILHLGVCDDLIDPENPPTDGLVGDSVSEYFQFTEKVSSVHGSYLELQTAVPGSTAVKCISVVKCTKFDGADHCAQYRSEPVYNVGELEQGAHVRLKDCDSENMPSQRFFWTADYIATDPPIYVPNPTTPAPTTKAPHHSPTESPTTGKPTKSPLELQETTPEPTATDANKAPISAPTGHNEEENTDTKGTRNNKDWLTGVLAFVGVLCFAIIVVGLVYYYKNKNQFTPVPNGEDENFVARV